MALFDTNLDPGDIAYFKGESITLPSDGTVSGGDAVTFDGSGNVTPASAESDVPVGVAGRSDLNGKDDKVAVHVAGLVVKVKLDDSNYSFGKGDLLVPSGSNAGEWGVSSSGAYIADTSTSSTAALNHPLLIHDFGDGTGYAMLR